MSQKRIILPTREPWFSKMRNGEKLDEYREDKDYYTVRFANFFGMGTSEFHDALVTGPRKSFPEIEIIFRNGYSKKSPEFTAYCRMGYGTGRPDWGAEPGKNYYILHIERYGTGAFCTGDIGETVMDEEYTATNISREERICAMRTAEADRAKEFLDDFLTPICMNEDVAYEDIEYEMMEKWSERNREKAKEYVQSLYNMAIGRR